MVKLDKTNKQEPMSRSQRLHSEEPATEKQSWTEKLYDATFGRFKKDEPEEELTFATKKAQGIKVNKKRVVTYSLLGLVVISTIGGLAAPLMQNINLSQPTEVKSDENLDATLKEVKRSRGEETTTMAAETSSSETPTETTAPAEVDPAKLEEEVNKKIQEGLETATKRVVEDYNKKLEEATKQVQDANTNAAMYKAERDALQKQVDELKQRVIDANNANAQSRPSTEETTTQAPQPDRLVIPGR